MGLNAAILSYSDAKALWDKFWNGGIDLTSQEDLELINSLGRNLMTSVNSARGLKRELGLTKPKGGNTTSATDGEGNTTQYTYDLSGNMVCIRDPTGEKEGHVIEKTG